MTPEQKQVIEKCKKLMKLGFPDLTGSVEFHLKPGADVKVKYVENQ